MYATWYLIWNFKIFFPKMSVSCGIRDVCVCVCVCVCTHPSWTQNSGMEHTTRHSWLGWQTQVAKRHNVRPCKCWCPYAFTTDRHSADVIYVTNGVKWCCLYCQIVSASFMSLYSFSTSFCQDRLITDMCDNSRKLAICGGKKLNVIQCQRILMMVRIL